MGEPEPQLESQVKNQNKKLEYPVFEPEPPSLNPRKKWESFKRSRKNLGTVRALLYGDQYAGLIPDICTEEKIREAFRHIEGKEKLDEVAGFFYTRDKSILPRFNILSGSSNTEKQTQHLITGVAASSFSVSAITTGITQTLRSFSWFLGPLWGFFSMGEILKGKGRPELRMLAKLNKERNQLVDFSKILLCSRDAKKDPLAATLLSSQKELSNKNPETLKKAAQKLARFKQTALYLGLTDKNSSFSAKINENNQWVRKRFFMPEVVDTIVAFEEKIFKAAGNNKDLQKELLYISLGLGAEPKNLKTAEETVVGLEAKLLRRAFDTRLKQAAYYSTISAAVGIASFHVLAWQLEKVWSTITGVKSPIAAVQEKTSPPPVPNSTTVFPTATETPPPTPIPSPVPTPPTPESTVNPLDQQLIKDNLISRATGTPNPTLNSRSTPMPSPIPRPPAPGSKG
jgi:hypothetical protein